MKSMDSLDKNWDEELGGGSPHDSEVQDDHSEVQAANMLRAMANPHRLKILKLLDEGPHNVMDLCERLNLRQSLASQHLARLRLDGIVTAERQGHHVIYTLQNSRAREILAVLDGANARPARGHSRKKRVNGGADSASVIP